jgi:hypothetical protein
MLAVTLAYDPGAAIRARVSLNCESLRVRRCRLAEDVVTRSPLHSGISWAGYRPARGGKRAKKAAVVAVARKLGVLLHRLWVSGEVYEPLRNVSMQQRHKVAAAA